MKLTILNETVSKLPLNDLFRWRVSFDIFEMKNMQNISTKELKLKFIEILDHVDGFFYEDGNPFLIRLNEVEYFVFLKNISSAYFPNSPDVTRVQLPQSKHFAEILNSAIQFLILGYDIDNDVFVSWNPDKIKDRLNAKSNVSLYSRASLQAQIKFNEFKEGQLSNGEKIILFDRENLSGFFQELPRLFEMSIGVKAEDIKKTENESAVNSATISFEITDKNLLEQIMPLLEEDKILQAIEICSNFYGDKYKDLKFKDWHRAVNNLHKKTNAAANYS